MSNGCACSGCGYVQGWVCLGCGYFQGLVCPGHLQGVGMSNGCVCSGGVYVQEVGMFKGKHPQEVGTSRESLCPGSRYVQGVGMSRELVCPGSWYVQGVGMSRELVCPDGRYKPHPPRTTTSMVGKRAVHIRLECFLVKYVCLIRFAGYSECMHIALYLCKFEKKHEKA